jgi:hypothetical protein
MNALHELLHAKLKIDSDFLDAANSTSSINHTIEAKDKNFSQQSWSLASSSFSHCHRP